MSRHRSLHPVRRCLGRVLLALPHPEEAAAPLRVAVKELRAAMPQERFQYRHCRQSQLCGCCVAAARAARRNACCLCGRYRRKPHRHQHRPRLLPWIRRHRCAHSRQGVAGCQPRRRVRCYWPQSQRPALPLRQQRRQQLRRQAAAAAARGRTHPSGGSSPASALWRRAEQRRRRRLPRDRGRTPARRMQPQRQQRRLVSPAQWNAVCGTSVPRASSGQRDCSACLWHWVAAQVPQPQTPTDRRRQSRQVASLRLRARAATGWASQAPCLAQVPQVLHQPPAGSRRRRQRRCDGALTQTAAMSGAQMGWATRQPRPCRPLRVAARRQRCAH